MGEAENRALVLDWVDAVGKNDVARIVAKYHAELVYTVMGQWPLAGTFGRDTVAEHAGVILKLFPEGLAFRAHKLVADGDWVAVDMESRGQHVSGKLYNNRYTFWIQVRDGQFVRLEEHLDTHHATDVLCAPVEPEALAIARRFFAAIERGDLAEVGRIYAPDVVVWHNIDRRSKTRDENLAMLAYALENVARLRYEDVRLEAIAGGFVETHVVRGTEKASGREMVLPAVVICQVAGGQITRLDEYFDSAQAPGGSATTDAAPQRR
jgi:ketosteroid isomerase-like protein